MVAIRDLGWPRLIPIKQSLHPSHPISRSTSTQDVKTTDQVGLRRRSTRRVSEGDDPIPESELVQEPELIPEQELKLPAPAVPAATPITPENDATVNYFGTSSIRVAPKPVGSSIPEQESQQPSNLSPVSTTSMSSQPMRFIEPSPAQVIMGEGNSVSPTLGSNHPGGTSTLVSQHKQQIESAMFSTDSILELVQLMPDTPIGGATPKVPGAFTPTGAYPTPVNPFFTAPSTSMNLFMILTYDDEGSPLPTPALPPTHIDLPAAKKRDFSHRLSECSTPSTTALPASDLIKSLPVQGAPNPTENAPSRWTGALPADKMSPDVAPGIAPTQELPVDDVTGTIPLDDLPARGIKRSLPLSAIPADAITGTLPLDNTGALPAPGLPPSNVSKAVKAKKKVVKAAKIGRRVLLRKPVLAVVLGRQLAGPTAFLLKQVSRGEALPDAVVMVGNAVPVPLPGSVGGAVPGTSSLPV